MKRKAVFLVALLALVAVPQALAAPSGASKAVRDAANAACKAERAGLGGAVFSELYGELGACRSEYTERARAAVKSAKRACKSERRAAPKNFRKKYGKGRKGRNAMPRCVAKKAAAGLAESVAANVDAGLYCAEDRQLDPEFFAEAYGSEADALAACVADQLAVGDGEEDDEADLDEGEGEDEDEDPGDDDFPPEP